MAAQGWLVSLHVYVAVADQVKDSWSALISRLCALMASNFLHLLEEKGVAKDVIEKLQCVGDTTMSRLALWVDTREELRGAMKDLGFDPTADLENKLKTVTVMDAWESRKRPQTVLESVSTGQGCSDCKLQGVPGQVG